MRYLREMGADDATPSEKLVISSYQVGLEAAERGDGIALGWSLSVQDRIDRGALVTLPGMAASLGDTINIYRPLYKKTTPVADAFVELMLGNLADRK